MNTNKKPVERRSGKPVTMPEGCCGACGAVNGKEEKEKRIEVATGYQQLDNK